MRFSTIGFRIRPCVLYVLRIIKIVFKLGSIFYDTCYILPRRRVWGDIKVTFVSHSMSRNEHFGIRFLFFFFFNARGSIDIESIFKVQALRTGL